MKFFESLVKSVEAAKLEAEKFEKGNASAGVRLRKHLMAIIKDAKAARQEVSDLKAKA